MADIVSLNEWVKRCHDVAVAAGWWDGVDRHSPTSQLAKIALIHSELSEALEGIRKNLMDSHLPHRPAVEVELADALIRIFDFAGSLRLDLEGAVDEKMAYNRDRPDHKPEARAAAGGKRI